MSRFLLIAFAVLLLVAVGCKGMPTKIDTPPKQAGEEEMGPAEGRAVGIMLFNLIPIKQNNRFDRAYAAALAAHPGAKRLVDIQIKENWFWAVILNGYRFEITGTAVR